MIPEADAINEYQVGTSSSGVVKESSLVLVQLGNGRRVPYFLVPETVPPSNLPTPHSLVTRVRSYLEDLGHPEDLKEEAARLFSSACSPGTSMTAHEVEDALEACEHLYHLSVTAQVMLHEFSRATVTYLPSNLEIAQALLHHHKGERVILNGLPLSILEVLNLPTPPNP